VSLLVGAWVARYLGPDQFGLLSYIVAFVSLFVPLGKLGFDGIVVRNVARDKEDINVLINSAIACKLIGNIVIVMIVSFYMYFLKKNSIYFYLALIISSIQILKSVEILEFYYRAKVKAKLISISSSSGLAASALLKIALILSSAGLIYFAIANVVEALVIAGLLIYIFRKEEAKLSFRYIEFGKGIALLKESWPLIFGSLFAVIYLNIDQVMIKEMLTNYDVGQYNAAVRISSVWYFIPITVGWSLQTAIVEAKKHGEKQYHDRLQQLFTLMAVIAYLLIIPIAYFSNDIIDLLFGAAYSAAGKVLRLHIVAAMFVFVGSIRGLWVTNESYFGFTLFSTLSAGLLNIILNFLWVPVFGILGAALATLAAYFFVFIASGMFFPPARKIVMMQLKSVLLIDLVKQIKMFRE